MSQGKQYSPEQESLNNVEPEAIGLAALTICEALLMVLVEKELIDDNERLALLQDCSEALSQSASDAQSASLHKSAADIVKFVEANSNSIKATQKIG